MAGGISGKGSLLLSVALARMQEANLAIQRNSQRGNTGVVTDALVIAEDAAIVAARAALLAIQ